MKQEILVDNKIGNKIKITKQNKGNEKQVKNAKDTRKITQRSKSQNGQPSQPFNATTLGSECHDIGSAVNFKITMNVATLGSECRGIEPTANMHAATLGSECRGIGWDFLHMPRHWEVNVAALSLLLVFSELSFPFSFSFLFLSSHFLLLLLKDHF